MSVTFERFLNQYHAKGKQQGEGYDLSHFDGLTPEELEIVEDILVRDALLALDSTAIRGLGAMRTRRSENILRVLLAIVLPPSYIHLCAAEELWEITRERALQETIIEDFSDDAELRRLALVGLLRTDPSPVVLKICLDMLIIEDPESIMRILAACGVLQFYQLMNSYTDVMGFQRNITLIRKLCDSTDGNTLDAAVAEVKKEASSLR